MNKVLLFPGKRVIATEICLFLITFIDYIDIGVKIMSGVAAIIVGVFAVINYVSKTRLNNTEHKIKQLELERKEQEWWEEQEKRKKV
jgi:hypothetical protein